jgi:hypothetical protein
MVKIVYPAGAHGNFLTYILNVMCGKERNVFKKNIYDPIVLIESKLEINGSLPQNSDTFVACHQCLDTNAVNIKISENDYFKYLVMMLSRTSGLNIDLDKLEFDPFNTLEKHSIFNHFLNNLRNMSGQQYGDVPRGILREWARVSFIEDSTLIKIAEKNSESPNSYNIGFDIFYDVEKFIYTCYKILDHYNIQPLSTGFLIDEFNIFTKNNRYNNIDSDCDLIKQSINQNKQYVFNDMNIIKEAWLDAWLSEEYGISPLLRDQYPKDTLTLIEEYKL